MIQDISPEAFRIEYRPDAVPSKDSRIVFFRDGKILLRRDGNRISFPLAQEAGETGGKYIYLFEISGKEYYFCDTQEEAVPDGFSYESPGIFRDAEPRAEAFALVTASHICSWYRDSRYCGRCGAEMVHDAAERMMRCPVCGKQLFPVICPAVITAVTDGDRLLLTRYATRQGAPSALVAGFNEAGETIEQTVCREVMEETGLRVKELRYYKSQPWGISGGLLMGFWCRLDGSDEVSLNDGELGEAVWRTREEIRESYRDRGISLTGEMIEVFSEGFDPYGT